MLEKNYPRLNYRIGNCMVCQKILFKSSWRDKAEDDLARGWHCELHRELVHKSGATTRNCCDPHYDPTCDYAWRKEFAPLSRAFKKKKGSFK
jgi:hypothetical protein